MYRNHKYQLTLEYLLQITIYYLILLINKWVLIQL